jgi:phosphoglycolate phosphatase-like HAD superfamily hydrolase
LPYSNAHLTNIKAVIFDFDGVILESADIKTVAFLELFGHRPDLQPAILAHHLDNLGVSRYDKFAWIYTELLGQPFSAEIRERLGRDFSSLVLEKVLACPFVPGAYETLHSLYSRMPLFVASGTPQEELDLIIEKRGLNMYFKEVWGSPHQKDAIIRDILGRYNLLPQEAVMVGDGFSDYKASVKTNLHFVARNIPEQEAFWQEQEIRYIVDDLISFPSLLGLI